MEVDDDDKEFLKNYDEAYAVYEANNPTLLRADGRGDLIKEDHARKYPNDIEYLKMLYGYIVDDNTRVRERDAVEQRRIQSLIPTVSLQPNDNYAPYLTYDFGPTMQPNTPFDSLFVRDEPSSMLLFMHLHGALIINQSGEPSIMTVPSVMLNKYSMSGTGKCNGSSVPFMVHILYKLCDAVQKNTPIDVETILNETIAHGYAKTTGPERALSMAPTMSTYQHTRGIEKQNNADAFRTASVQTQPYGKRLVETHYGDVADNNKHTYGAHYVEKIYTIQNDGIARDGIFICKDWSEIGAKCMDNLMDNMQFKLFIVKKYKDEEQMLKIVANLDFVGNPSTSLDCVSLSDVLEFCATVGKPNVSMVDSTCSNFMTKTISSVSNRQITNALKFLKNPEYDNVAKGVKRTKKDRVNKSRVKGNRGKATKKRRRVKDKNKRTHGR
jgi:hypothetical protein